VEPRIWTFFWLFLVLGAATLPFAILIGYSFGKKPAWWKNILCYLNILMCVWSPALSAYLLLKATPNSLGFFGRILISAVFGGIWFFLVMWTQLKAEEHGKRIRRSKKEGERKT